MYYNYHSHKVYTNIRVNDCITTYEDYIARAKELGHKAVFSTEHGNSGNILKLYGLCEENDLLCIHGYESYFTFDRRDKEGRNYHICIISLNRNGMHANNRINSIANIDGFYRQPRVDMELLLTLPPEDVVVTTACINNPIGFPDEDFDTVHDYLLMLKAHFGDHFFLEIQDHNDEDQIRANRRIKELSFMYDIPLIHGCDTHYIYPSDKDKRMNYLIGKGYEYSYEDGFILDYPDEATIYERYARQGVFNKKEVKAALDATLIFEQAEDLGFDKSIKMPTIYPDLPLDDRVGLLKSHVNERWKEYIKAHPASKEKKHEMMEGIRKEMKVVEDVNDKIRIADYFLLNEEIIKRGVEKGGVITRTGRGSAPSYFMNTLLGFSTINRFTAPIQLFPARFISTARLLETRSMPDIDFNVVNEDPFIEASIETLGEHHCYRMIAYGTQRENAAFRNACRNHNIDFKEANEVSKNLDKYRNDPKWAAIFEEANEQIDVVDSVSPSPCSFLLYDGDIWEEFGLIKIKGELCVNLEKNMADEWKYLKNDILTVTVWGLISKTFELIGKSIPPYEELVTMCDKRVWDNFGKGMTTTINQCNTANGKAQVKAYKPRNLAELALFVAMIRPGAASLLQGFLAREPYTTGVAEIDELLESSSHYMAYQESIMAVLQFLGIHEDETYSIIKKISKKKFKEKELEELKTTLESNFNAKVKKADDGAFDRIWKVIEDAAAYSFNSSHALCTATDALYGMYLKTNYPLEYFTVCFNAYSDDIETTAQLSSELDYFGLHMGEPVFREARSEYTFDKETNTIHKGIASVKGVSAKDADALYEMRDTEFDDFVDVLHEIGDKKVVHMDKLKNLITINFFKEFGGNKKLLALYEVYREWGGRKQIKKEKAPDWMRGIDMSQYGEETDKMYKNLDMRQMLKDYAATLPDESLSVTEQIKEDIKLAGTPLLRIESDPPMYYVMALDTKFTPWGTFYNLNTGEITKAKVQKKKYNTRPFKERDVLYISGFEEKPKWYKTEDGFEQSKTEKELHVATYTICGNEKEGEVA